MTSDEPAHLANGYTIVTTGSFWSTPRHGHPPLINVWTTWPLLLEEHPPDVRSLPGWQENLIVFTRALWPKFTSIERMAVLIRYPIMLLAVLLMAFVYRWTCDWFGNSGALLAISIMAWDPTLLAHAQLNTTDLGMTLSVFATLYIATRLIRRFTWKKLIAIGIGMGAAMSAKTSGLMLVPVIALIFGWGWLQVTHHQKTKALSRAGLKEAQKWLGYTIVTTLIGVLVLWATYGFEIARLPESKLLLPLASHLQMVQIFLKERGRVAFMNGEICAGGWWWYFPFAFSIKTPIPWIIALLITLALALKKTRRSIWQKFTLWSFPLLYIIVALQGGVNIGYRHMLPTFPFIYVGMGEIGFTLAQVRKPLWRHALTGLLVLMGLWYIGGTLNVTPFTLAYFNEFIGGPQNGYRYLVDSNVDWGQSFKALQRYMQEEAIDKVQLSYFTWVDPAVYGINYDPLFPSPGTVPYMPRRYHPAPGVYAISATTLQGIALKEHDPDLYEWFRHQEPTAQPGYGLLVYNVLPDDPPPTWIAQCNIPVIPLDHATIQERLGYSDLRELNFDCTQSWVYPQEGQQPGWYSIFYNTLDTETPFFQERLKSAALTYEHTLVDQTPKFLLFKREAEPPLVNSEWNQTVQVAPSNWLPEEAERQGLRVQAPITLDGPLIFLGYKVLRSPHVPLELWTAWEIKETPERPLSLMAHVLGKDGIPLAVGDGFGVPPEQLRPHDIVIQRHIFTELTTLPEGAYWLQTGAYWLDDLTRLPIARLEINSDRLLLPTTDMQP